MIAAGGPNMGRCGGFASVFAACLFVFGASFAHAYTLKSYEGRFSIEFPSAPAAKVVQGIGSCESIRHEFQVSEGRRTWIAIYKDCKPPGMLADMGINPSMRDISKAIAKALGGEVRANDPIELGPLSGREFLIYIERMNIVVRGRVFIEGDRIYQLMYFGPAGTQEDPVVEAFFASFRVMR
jgi:hypothetical protein